MWLKAQNEMAGLWPHAAMGPVERMVRQHQREPQHGGEVPCKPEQLGHSAVVYSHHLQNNALVHVRGPTPTPTAEI